MRKVFFKELQKVCVSVCVCVWGEEWQRGLACREGFNMKKTNPKNSIRVGPMQNYVSK